MSDLREAAELFESKGITSSLEAMRRSFDMPRALLGSCWATDP